MCFVFVRKRKCVYMLTYMFFFWGGWGLRGIAFFFFCMSPHRAVGAAVLCVSVLADDTVALL